MGYLRVALMLAAASSLAGSALAQDTMVDRSPMTIAASCVGRFAHGYSWHLSVNSAGQAELTILTPLALTRRTFTVPPERLAELRKAVEKEHFLALPGGDYGDIVTDGSITTVTVALGDHVTTARLHFFGNPAYHDPARLDKPAHAIRIAMLIRGWFDDDRAVDLRRYEQAVLDRAKK